MKKIFITGTDTDVGKTIVSAGLCMAWPAHYWKPIQAGYQSKNFTADSGSKKTVDSHIFPQTDNETISRFIPKENIYPSSYTLKEPLSPHQAAERENIHIHSKNIKMPHCPSNLIIEGAGGALVPFNSKEDMTDLMKQMNCPVIVVARSTLGTLNHTFLTLTVLRKKNIPVLGIVMVGPSHALNKKDIIKKAPVLLELPFLKSLSTQTLLPYFEKIKLP